MYYEVIPAEVFRNGGGVLTYSSDAPMLPGQIVQIPLGRKKVLGIIYRKVKKVDFPTKPIEKVVCPFPLPNHLLKTIFWLSQYYLTPIPLVADLLIPAGLTSKNALKGYLEPLEGASDQKCGTIALTDKKPVRTPLRKSKNTVKTSNLTTKTAPGITLSDSSLLEPPASTTLAPEPLLNAADTQAQPDSAIQAQTDSDTQALPSSSVQALTESNHPSISFSTAQNPKNPSPPQFPLNPAQLQALAELEKISSNTRLLRGVTGSGKTNIYLKLAADTLKNNQSVILLVPEIALTSQLVKIFERTFGEQVTLIHSRQTMTERRKTWLDIITQTFPPQELQSIIAQNQQQNQRQNIPPTQDTPTTQSSTLPNNDSRATIAPLANPRIIIGPRSALLAPLHNLGLIIIDEAHENAYYQENPPRYSALRLASFIAATQKIPCILGTATPNIVDYHLAQSKNSLVTLQQKAKTTAIDAKITIIDLKQRENFLRNRYFSNSLLTAIEKNIQDKHQALIFHNRRGSAPLTICENCGWQALCPECFLPMTLHTDTYTLNCHICGHSEKVPTNCPNCQHVGIIHKGFGTKLLESELAQLFPAARIARFDGDNKKDEDLATLYDEVKAGEIDILIGTQTLAKGLDLPHLATVGIVQADAGLALPDFAAEERTFELLTQVIGRVGRGHTDKAEVIIQSYQPDHPVIQAAKVADYEAFAKYLLQHRREQQMPPFSYLARLSITYKTERTTLAKIRQAYTELQRHSNVSVSPPAPAFHERTTRGFTWQILIKATSRETLRKALAPYAGNSQYSLVLDPPSLL